MTCTALFLPALLLDLTHFSLRYKEGEKRLMGGGIKKTRHAVWKRRGPGKEKDLHESASRKSLLHLHCQFDDSKARLSHRLHVLKERDSKLVKQREESHRSIRTRHVHLKVARRGKRTINTSSQHVYDIGE